MSEVERVLVAPGTALVAREGSTVLLVSPTSQHHEELVSRILDWASDSPDGADLVRQVGALVTGLSPGDVPPLGLVTLTAASSAVVLCAGDVRAVIETESEARTELCGLDAVTYVERLVDPDGNIRVMLPLTADLDGWSPLATDTVHRGGGFLVCLRPEPVPVAPEDRSVAPSADASADASADVDVDALAPGNGTGTGTGTGDGPWMEAEPTLVGLVMPPFDDDVTFEDDLADEDDAATEAGGGVRVWGVRCENGHFTRPAVATCLTCGVALDPASEPFRDLRPSRGWIVADHGEQRELVADVIIGREPGIAVDVLASLADALPLSDSKLAMSRVHSRIRLEGWDVRVEDLGSANGTFLSVVEGEWELLTPGESHVVSPGARIAVGSRVLRLDPPS